MNWTRRGARLTVLAALAVVLTVPATSSATTLPLLGGCAAATYEQPFLRWLDVGTYVLMPNGGLEAGTTGWRLTGGAALAAGNETYYVHGAGDTSSLSLPSGSSATTSTLC